MSVLIKGVDMPKNCADCPCGNAQDGWCYVHNKVLERMGNGYPSTETRPDWCPLVEVPTPHVNFIKRLYLRHKFRKFCRLNNHYCPDCIYRNFVWDGIIFRGNKCLHPLSKYD